MGEQEDIGGVGMTVSMSKEPPMNVTAVMDQAGAFLKGLSAPLGEYYLGLINAGIPPEYAVELLRDFHWLQICNALFPGQLPRRRED